MYPILGLPLFFTTLWIILRALLENHLCWTTNANPYIFWSSIRAPITASVLVMKTHQIKFKTAILLKKIML